MAKNSKDTGIDEAFVARFNLMGLVVYSSSLVAAGALIVFGLRGFHFGDQPAQHSDSANHSATEKMTSESPAWGELVESEIKLEAPEEYVGFELKEIKKPAWYFPGTSPDQVRTLLTSCGVAPNQIERALSQDHLTYKESVSTITTDDELVFSLSPETRSKLYRELSKSQLNHYMQYPFVFPGKTFDECFTKDEVPDAVETDVRKLLYSRGDTQCFSDYEIIMQHLKSQEERINLVKTLSRQSAVLARLRIRPDTDVDKILGYWDKGSKVKDLRPLLEAMARLPEGSSISLLYLLPPFARQRLFTFPLPNQENDPAMDCHWTTMNFFNETPDNHFTDPVYTVSYLKTNYYTVAAANNYGDIILFLDATGNAIHSAVYLASDLVFTKNGNNFSQPWKITHLSTLTARYELDSPERLMIWRRKNS